VVDPLGGINTLWPLFGISNQMLAGIALILATCVLIKMKKDKFAWVTALPAVWLLICTLTAGWQKIVHANPKIGFLAHADKYQAALAKGEVLAPAKSAMQMQQIVFNDYVDAALAGMFIFVVVSIALFGIRTIIAARNAGVPTARESRVEPVPVSAIG
jgi:carbon starvation protein